MFPKLCFPISEISETYYAARVKEQCTESEMDDQIWKMRHTAHYLVRLIRSTASNKGMSCKSDAFEELKKCRVTCRIAVKAKNIIGAFQ